MVRTIRYLVIGCWLVGLWTGTMIAQDSQYEFGVVPFFKNYPEFKRGFDPYADLSGTVQENVDRYSGKLSLTFQLPGIPWSETTAFAPVLHYTSNVWSYRQSYGDKFLVGGLNKMGEPPPQEPPFDYERPQVKFPDYWGNDAWVRFSPIGRPHAMPGWTLAVGGVYTEFVKSAEEIGSTGETNHYKTWVEKKIFVSPDGTPHVMLDVETRGRPFMTGAFFTTPPDDPNYCNPEYDPLSHARECLPRSRWNDPTLVTGVWQAIDGSHYYYLEDQHKVYAADGTCYELVSDPNDRFYGMISRIIDPRGNAITVTVQDPGEHVTGVRTYRYASNTGAWLELRFDQVVENHFAPFDPFDPHIDYQLDILLLKQIIWSGVDGNPLTYTFTRSELIDHLRLDDPSIPATMTFADVLATPDGDGIISCYGSFLDLDISNWVFCSRDQPANGSEVTNKRIHVLTGIILPDGRRYQFQYNRAGKLSHVLYPDGGYRHYLYGNTREPSTPVEVNCPPMGWHGREAGSSPFGGVSLVYQSEAVGATEQLERAYAYCGYWTDNGVPQPGETITWYADGSAQLHRFAAPEIWEDRRKLLQFGYSAWTTGKLERVQYYTQGPTALDDPTLRRFLWISQEGDPHPMATSEYMQLKTDLNIGGGTAPRALLREEESYWTNYSAGWEWSPPEGYCPNCLPGDRQIALSVYFQDLIPGPGQSWAGSPFVNYYRPEWNTVLARKVEKTYEGGGAPVVHRTDYEYGDAIAWGWTAVHAVQTGQKEFDTVGGTTPYRRSATEYQHFWPHPDSIPTGMPARVLGLATRSQVYDASEQVISESFTNYVEDPVATANTLMGLQPRRTLSLIQSSPERWSETEMEYEMRTVGSSSAVRLVTVKPKDSGAVRNTVRFDYDPASGLLRNLRAYTGDESVLKLYMCLDHDPFTGLLRRRMDRNGDRDGDCQFDAGDDYIEFSYDAFNRLSGVARWHGGKAEVLSAYLYPDTTPFVVQRCDYLDEQTRRWTRVRNDALGRAAETWTTLTGDQAAYSVKTFDVLGRVVTESNPVAVTVNPVTGTWNTDGSAYVTSSAYDALGRVVAQTAPGGFTVSTAFGLGTARDIVTGAATIPATTERVTEQVGGEARWRQLYRDAFGRIVQVDECLPDGGAGEWRTLYGYDAADRLRQVDKRAADGATGQRRVFDYNAAGWLTAVQLPEYADQKMRYAYDDLGNVTAKELVSAMYGSSLGYAETLAYDALSRLTARTVTLLGTTTWHTFTYDGGAVAAPPAGHPGDFAWGRLTHDRTTYGLDPGAVAVERFVRYNWQGLPEEKAERFGTLVDEDTVAGEEFVTAYTATDPDKYAYDRQGNLRAMVYPSGQAVAWEYQDGGTLREVSAGGRAIFSNLAYAAHGAVAGMRLGDAATGQAGWGQAFDAARLWPVRIVAGTTAVTANTSTASGAVLFGLDYDNYEANGNIAAVTRKLRLVANGTQYTLDFGYSYDRLNRLAGCAVTDTVYTYAMDEFGNITARTQAAGGGGELPSSLALVVNRATNRLGGDGYFHDVLGNLVQMPAGVDFVTMSYLDQGHIGTLTDAAGVVWKYYYDADGKRRIKVKTTGGAATEPDGQGGVRLVADRSFYFYEGEDLICQQDVGALVARIPGTDDIDESVYGPKFLLLDHLGSTRAELVFTESGGVFSPVIQEYYDLMPYGEVITPPSTQESVLFTGKPRDIESGLDIFPFRPFSNQLCRWICADEPFADNWVEDPQSWNLFTYCRNNSATLTDPDGRAVPLALVPVVVYVASNPAVQKAFTQASTWTAVTLGVVTTAAWAATQVSAVNESTGYWGQQHYHKESKVDQGGSGSPDPEAPKDPKQRGRESEKRVLEDMGEPKNTQKVSSQEGNSIPDINNSNQLGDIKDTQRVTNTKQIRIQRDAANQAGKQPIVVTGTNTKVSSTVTSQGTQVIRRDDLGPKK